jgi:hypothetical protein
MAREYVFVDEWDLEAPILAVFRALCDATTYPLWWKPVYVSVEADGPLRVGRVARERFRGRFAHELFAQSEIVRLEPPRQFDATLFGDVSGHRACTLSKPSDHLVQVRLELRVRLSAAQRPGFRWSHRWAVERAIRGLEPYARASASVPVSAASST